MASVVPESAGVTGVGGGTSGRPAPRAREARPARPARPGAAPSATPAKTAGRRLGDILVGAAALLVTLLILRRWPRGSSTFWSRRTSRCRCW